MLPKEWSIAVLALERDMQFPKIHPILGARKRADVDSWFLRDANANGQLSSNAQKGIETWGRKQEKHPG